MKVIWCINCQDMIKIRRERRTCACGKSSCQLIDDDLLKAEISGPCLPIAISNQSLNMAWNSWIGDKRTVFVQGWLIDVTQEINDVTVIAPDSK